MISNVPEIEIQRGRVRETCEPVCHCLRGFFDPPALEQREAHVPIDRIVARLGIGERLVELLDCRIDPALSQKRRRETAFQFKPMSCSFPRQ